MEKINYENETQKWKENISTFNEGNYKEDLDNHELKVKQEKEEANIWAEILSDIYQEKENIKLKEKHEAILNLEIPWEQKKLRDILENKELSADKKIESIVKSIHSMNDKITITIQWNNWETKDENCNFYCGQRALFLNYIFNNSPYKETLGIESATIALPYGHCMNLVKMWWKTFIADWWAWWFNQIDGKYTKENKWSWECIKLQQPIETYPNSWNFYPFTSFPYTEELSNNELEVYTSYNLQLYKYDFTNKIYISAHNKGIKANTKEDLKEYVNNILSKEEKPLLWILEENDPQLKNTKNKQLEILNRNIENALSFDTNKAILEWMENYIKWVTKNHKDLAPTSKMHNEWWREEILSEFNSKDAEIMSALNIPKEHLQQIKELLERHISHRWLPWDNIYLYQANFIISLYNKNEPILWKWNDELNKEVRNFVNAIIIKAWQLNKDANTYLASYLEQLNKKNK